MKITIQKAFIVVLLTSMCSCQSDKSNPIATSYPEKQEEIRALLTEILDVAKSKNPDALDTYHLNSPKFSKFDDGDIPARQDYEMGKKTENDFYNGVKEFNYTLPDTKVDVFDDIAIATFILDYRVVLNDSTIAGKSRGTMVFANDSGRWKIVHEHFSPVVGGQ